MGEAINYGWSGFKNNAGAMIILIAAYALISIAMNMLAPKEFNFFYWVWYVLELLVSFVLSVGLIRAALIVVEGKAPTVEAILTGRDLGTYIIASVLATTLVIVGMMLCFIPGVIAAFLLGFTGYAIVDHRTGGLHGPPQSDPVGALRTSYELTSQNAVSILLFVLASIGINIVGALFCGVGLLVSVPVTLIAAAFTWRWFSGGFIAPQP